jgi:hypothetical protein
MNMRNTICIYYIVLQTNYIKMPLIASNVIVTGEGSLDATPIPGSEQEPLTVSERAKEGEHEVVYAQEQPPSPKILPADDCNVKKTDAKEETPVEGKVVEKEKEKPAPRPKRKTRKRVL